VSVHVWCIFKIISILFKGTSVLTKKKRKRLQNIYLLGSEWELLDCIAANASTALLTALMASKADVNGLLEDVVVVGKLGGSVEKII